MLGALATGVVLTGCGGSQPPIGAPGAIPQSRVATHAERGGAWMLPEAKSEDLIYVSSPDYYPPSYTSNVYVYAYPSGTLVGTFTGFDNVGGLCSDADGNVWVTNAVSYDSGGYVYEYGHGATNPKK